MTLGPDNVPIDGIDFKCYAAKVNQSEEKFVVENGTCYTHYNQVFIIDNDTGEFHTLNSTKLCNFDFQCQSNSDNINELTPLIVEQTTDMFYVFPYGLFYK